MEERRKKKKRFRDTIWYRLLTTLLLLALCAGVGAGYAYSEFYGNPDKTVEEYMADKISKKEITDITDYQIVRGEKDGKDIDYTVKYWIFDEANPDDEKGILKTFAITLHKTSPWYQPVAEWEITEME